MWRMLRLRDITPDVQLCGAPLMLWTAPPPAHESHAFFQKLPLAWLDDPKRIMPAQVRVCALPSLALTALNHA
jgi:hypothetical protein